MTRRGEGVVEMAALDLRRRPDHRSELRSQLLLGETVEVLRRTGDGVWARVRNRADGYVGWARTWGIREVSSREAAAWKSQARWRVVAHLAYVRMRPGSGAALTPAFWNSPLVVGGRSGRYREVVLPSGRRGWIESASVRLQGRRARSLRRLVDGLLGTPYIWGGRTPLGFDCSGFVQQVFAARGMNLPRDAKQQFMSCRPLGRGLPWRAGDLVFFGRRRGPVSHVGILLGRTTYAHARGVVRVNSLDSRNALYDNVLVAQMRGFGRPRRSPVRGGDSS